MNAVDAGGPGAYSGHWNGGRLFFDVPELTIQAGNYNTQELAAQLPRELERSMRESPHLRHIAALLPHVRRVEMHTNGIEPPIQTFAATAADIADVIVNWCCAKLYRTVGEENLAHAAARKAELRALREHSAITGPIRPVQSSAPVKVAAELPAVPQTYAEAQEQYLKWLAERGLEDPDGWLLGVQQDSSEDEGRKEEDIPADFEGLDAWYAQREQLLPGPLKAAYMTATFTKGFLAGAGGIVIDLLVIAGRFFNGTILYLLSGGNFFQEDHAFAIALSNELFALPGNLLTGKASDDLIKQLNMLLARLDRAESSYGKGKALAELLVLVVPLFAPQYLAANPALAERFSNLSRLLGKGKKGPGRLLEPEIDLQRISLPPTPKVKVLKTLTAEEVNALNPSSGLWDLPFLRNTHIRLVELQEDMVFLRFKTATNGDIGSFLVRAKEVAGMTPEQIYKHLALESVPTHVQSVAVPKGRQLYHGRVGPQAQMGHPDKGGWQFKLARRLEEGQFGPWREF